MIEEGLNNLVYSKNVIELITVANEFCSFLEHSEDKETSDFLGRLQKLLPLLYLKASLLPEFEMEADDELEKYVNELDYNLIQQKVLHHTGAGDDYQEVFLSGMQFSESALTASIAENVADIYQDMKDFVILYQKPLKISKENAVHECKQVFQTRTGYRLVNVIQIIHHLLYTETSVSELAEFEDIF